MQYSKSPIFTYRALMKKKKIPPISPCQQCPEKTNNNQKKPLPKWSITTEKYSQGNKSILCPKRTCTKCRGWNKAWMFYFLQSSSHYFNRQRITKQQNFDGSTYFPHTLSVRGLFRERPNNLWHLSQKGQN